MPRRSCRRRRTWECRAGTGSDTPADREASPPRCGARPRHAVDSGDRLGLARGPDASVRRKRRMAVVYLYANGVGSRIIAVDTVLRGLLGFKDGDYPPRVLRRLHFVGSAFAELKDFNERLSYMSDWRDAFL